MPIASYAKFIVAAIGAVLTTLVTAFGADTTIGRVAAAALSILTAISVYVVPNATEDDA